jgi:prevent-host-death family protein
MNAVWQVQEAKSRFSELVERAQREGPQLITRHGRPVARVVALGAADAAGTEVQSDDGFVEFLLNAPKLEGGLPAMPRSPEAGRPPLFGEQ